MQVFQAEALRHPAAALGLPSGGSFVPNDIALGGQAPPFLVLTGPNMGGKSTLLRQVCLTYHSLHALARGFASWATELTTSGKAQAISVLLNTNALRHAPCRCGAMPFLCHPLCSNFTAARSRHVS